MKKKWMRVIAAIITVGIVAGNASSVAYAHHSRRVGTTGTTTSTAVACYQDGSCDINGICQIGGICNGIAHTSGYHYGARHYYGHH